MPQARHLRAEAAAFGLIVALALSGCQPPLSDSQTQVVEGVQFDYGVVKSDVVLGHPPNHPERAMHEGVPTGFDIYHVVLALRDAKAGTRIRDTDVSLAVSGPGHPGHVLVALTPMGPADVLTYGGYVSLPAEGKYRLTFDVARAGQRRRAARARFLFQRPSG